MDKRQKNMLTLLMVIAIAISGVFFVLYNVEVSAPIAPDPEPVDTDNDGIVDADISFSMYQAMHLRFKDGTSSWKYPQSRTILTPLVIVDVDTGKSTSNLQTYIYFTLSSSKQVSYITFTASATILLKQLGATKTWNVASMTINEPASNVQNGVDTYLISSSMTVSNFEDLLTELGVPPLIGSLHYIVKLSNIKATVKFADGSTTVFGLTGVQATENQLWWTFHRTLTEPMEITHEQVEWKWEP